MATADVIEALQERFPELGIEARPLCRYLDGRDSDQFCVRIPPERLIEVMTFLRNDPRTRFEQLCDLTCVDYLNYPTTADTDVPPDGTTVSPEDRFGVTYSLLSLRHNHRLWVKVFVNDPDPEVPSVYGLWKGADWPEREVFDLFGIRFTGHPDLRRILLPEDFTESPLRKDYPLRGKGERKAFDVVRRDSA